MTILINILVLIVLLLGGFFISILFYALAADPNQEVDENQKELQQSRLELKYAILELAQGVKNIFRKNNQE